jgi:hypothetical protein
MLSALNNALNDQRGLWLRVTTWSLRVPDFLKRAWEGMRWSQSVDIAQLRLLTHDRSRAGSASPTSRSRVTAVCAPLLRAAWLTPCRACLPPLHVPAGPANCPTSNGRCTATTAAAAAAAAAAAGSCVRRTPPGRSRRLPRVAERVAAAMPPVMQLPTNSGGASHSSHSSDSPKSGSGGGGLGGGAGCQGHMHACTTAGAAAAAGATPPLQRTQREGRSLRAGSGFVEQTKPAPCCLRARPPCCTQSRCRPMSTRARWSWMTPAATTRASSTTQQAPSTRAAACPRTALQRASTTQGTCTTAATTAPQPPPAQRPRQQQQPRARTSRTAAAQRGCSSSSSTRRRRQRRAREPTMSTGCARS